MRASPVDEVDSSLGAEPQASSGKATTAAMAGIKELRLRDFMTLSSFGNGSLELHDAGHPAFRIVRQPRCAFVAEGDGRRGPGANAGKDGVEERPRLRVAHHVG